MKSIDESSPVLAVVSLQMEDRIEEIRVQENDDIDLIVDLFCQRYNLGRNCHEYLVDQITQKLKREHSPQFGDNRMQTTKQSDFGQTTQASSIDDNQSSAQKSYELWQKKLNQKLNSEPTVQWQTSYSPKSYLNNTSKINTTGERMYRDAMDQQKLKKEKAEFIQYQRKEKEIQYATFKPAISPRSREIVEQKKKNYQDISATNIGDQLFEKGKKLQEKKQQMIIQHQEQEKKLSPFQPRRFETGIRNKSTHSQSRSQQKNKDQIFEKLFLKAKEDQKKRSEHLEQEFKKIYPFQPQINRNNQINDVQQQQQKQIQKLYQDQKLREKKLEDLKRENCKQQNTFQPTINKDNNAYRKVSKRVDYEDTLLAQDMYKVHQKLNNKSVSSSTQMQDTGIQNQNNGKQLFDENIKKIFTKLDGDQDGYIDKNNINLSAIDVSLLELVSEVLYKIEDEEITTDQDQFKDICLQLGLGSKLDSKIFKL